MSEDELREHTKKLRELSSSAPTIKAKIKQEGKKKVAKKTAKKKTPKVDINKYLQMGKEDNA